MAIMVSGIQPTGKLHLGNYLGAISSWIKYQTQYDAYFFIADYHALTGLHKNPDALHSFKMELVLDLLALGVNPHILFFQSDVPEHAELHLLLSMITPLSWLERVPTYKDKLEHSSLEEIRTYGFLGYPVLQTADILIYQADVVPVGRDQLPHLELAREICRRYQHLYGPSFREPEALLTEQAVLPGLDGQKMSKSYGNTIPIMTDPVLLNTLIKTMVTDPKRVRKSDPGTPDICPVYQYHNIFSNPSQTQDIASQCRNAEIGCIDCKKICASAISEYLAPVQAKRHSLSQNLVKEQLIESAKRARTRAKNSLFKIKADMGL